MPKTSLVFSMLAIALGSSVACQNTEPLPTETSPADNTSGGTSGQTSTQAGPVPTSPPEDTGSPATTTPTTSATTPVSACDQAFVEDPTVSLTGVAWFTPEQKSGNPAAGDPTYVYLAAGKEGVILTGPSVANAESLLTPVSPAITMIGVRSTSADGYDVVVNPDLGYHVAIGDFEFEVSLARVELCLQDGEVQSRFLFKGNAGASGVAHQITISPTTTSKVTSLPSPVTVEVR